MWACCDERPILRLDTTSRITLRATARNRAQPQAGIVPYARNRSAAFPALSVQGFGSAIVEKTRCGTLSKRLLDEPG